MVGKLAHCGSKGKGEFGKLPYHGCEGEGGVITMGMRVEWMVEEGGGDVRGIMGGRGRGGGSSFSVGVRGGVEEGSSM